MENKVTLTKAENEAMYAMQRDMQGQSMQHVIQLWIKQGHNFKGTNKLLYDMGLEKFVRAWIGHDVENIYEVGQWVVYKNDVCVMKTEKIDRMDDSVTQNKLVKFAGKNSWALYGDIQRYATEKEIAEEKERIFWDKIGRSVSEFVEGDLVCCDGKYYKLFNNMGCGTYRQHMSIESAKEKYDSGEIDAFYPARSLIQFESEGE